MSKSKRLRAGIGAIITTALLGGTLPAMADFEAHVAAPHVQDWFAKLPELADGTVQVTPLHILNERR